MKEKLNKTRLNNMIDNNEELSNEDIEYLMYKTDNRDDYLLLNYIEKRIIEGYGGEFIKNSENKIGYLLELFLEDNPVKVYTYYKGIFEEYMNLCGFQYEAIGSFNLIFFTHCHIVLKIIKVNNS